jgi:hypothetical protein
VVVWGKGGTTTGKRASVGRAPRAGVPEPRKPDRSNHKTTAWPFTPGHLARRVWHPRRGAGLLVRRCPEVAAPYSPRRPPATFWQPSWLTNPECPNSSPSTCPRFSNRAERIAVCTDWLMRAGNMTMSLRPPFSFWWLKPLSGCGLVRLCARLALS